MDLNERIARRMCRVGGIDPDEIRHIDGSVGVSAPAWMDFIIYADVAIEEIEKEMKAIYKDKNLAETRNRKLVETLNQIVIDSKKLFEELEANSRRKPTGLSAKAAKTYGGTK